jgi:biopolymer transport protein ExbD
MSRFKKQEGGGEEEVYVNMTSLIDCIFILLLFFIVCTTFVDETGVEVDKPQAASAASLEKTSVLLAITAKGAVVYGGQEIGVGGVQTIVKRLLEKEEIPVIIQADKAVPSGLLVRVIDEAKLGGAAKVSLATRREAADS